MSVEHLMLSLILMLRSGSSSEIHNKYIDLNIDNRQIGKGLQILSKDHLVGRVNLTTATM